MNFIAFNFCDNDFHTALREAVEFIGSNVPIADMDLKDIHRLAVNGIQAFQSLGAIAKNRDVADYTGYIDGALSVFRVRSIDELKARWQGEGYVYNTRTWSTSYWAGY